MSEANRQILEPVLKVIRPSLESNSHLKTGHYLEFEYIVSKWCLGLRPWNFFCTYLAERNLTNGLVSVNTKDFFGLADLVRRYCKFQISKDEQKGFDLKTPLTDEQVTYLALDIRLPTVIRGAQEAKIKRDGLARSVQIDNNAIPAFGDMHLNGMLPDPELWKQIISDNERDLKLAVAEMDKHFIPIVGQKVKWDQDEIDRLHAVYKSYDEPSPEEVALSEQLKGCRKDPVRKAELTELRAAHQAMRKVAKEKAKLEYTTERAKGNAKAKSDYSKAEGEAAINYQAPQQLLAAIHAGEFGLNAKNFKSSGDEELEKHIHIPIIKSIRQYRSVKTALKMFGYRWLTSREEKDPITKKFGFVDPDTGRIHAKFKQFGADTGRPACTSPNMLNVPNEDRYREAFISRPGYDMVDKDCAGQELRVLVEYTQEPAWLDAFRRGKDVHSISAEMISKQLWKQAANMTESIMLVDGKPKTIPPCAYFHNDREECVCPGHKVMRKRYKALTLGKVMGKTVYSFAQELGLSKEDTQKVIDDWENELRITQTTLENLRNKCYEKREARTIAGRRRIITQVTYESAKKSALEKYGDKCDQNKITQTMQSKIAAVKREGANVNFQGTAADQMLLAMGCGFDPNGKPYLWHILEPKYRAMLLLYLYDELLVESPEEHSRSVELDVEDAIIRSGAEFVKSVPMVSKGMVSKRWQK
jgi:DNA polymerase I-like protein with 3'-5' exonuclease and polymerase domains